ncbi:hypothetical protein BH23BAC3_BH23BAC3_13130 [soil metagenome]
MILLSLCKRWYSPNLGEVEFSEIIRRLADAFTEGIPMEKLKWLDQRIHPTNYIFRVIGEGGSLLVKNR